MSTPHPMDSENLARLCAVDSGAAVTPDDVRKWTAAGVAALTRFSDDEIHEINATLLKAFADPAGVPIISAELAQEATERRAT